MYRRKREPAPFFRQPGAPFNPTTGQHAQLTPFPVKGTVLSLFQVVAADTHDNYVACRGYEAEADPEFRYLHDPHTVATTTPINVAKPYSLRGTFPYELGQVIVAARIKGHLGYNPGKAVTVGQPADLNEAISKLTDDAGVSIAWLDIGAPPSATKSYLLAGEGGGFGTVTSLVYGNWSFGDTVQVSGDWSWNGSSEFTWNGVQTWMFVSITVRGIPSIHITSTTRFNFEIQKSPYGALAGNSVIMDYPPQNIADGWMDTATWTGPKRFDNGDKIKLAGGRVSGDAAVSLSSVVASLSIIEL